MPGVLMHPALPAVGEVPACVSCVCGQARIGMRIECVFNRSKSEDRR